MTTGEMIGYLRAGNKYGILNDVMANGIAARLEALQKAVDNFCEAQKRLVNCDENSYSDIAALFALRTPKPKETPK